MEPKIIGFERKGTGDWYVLDNGTKISTGDGERVLRFIRTVDMSKRAIHLSEAMGYVVALMKLKVSQALYAMAKKVTR